MALQNDLLDNGMISKETARFVHWHLPKRKKKNNITQTKVEKCNTYCLQEFTVILQTAMVSNVRLMMTR
jgi:hypothetical protein